MAVGLVLVDVVVGLLGVTQFCILFEDVGDNGCNGKVAPIGLECVRGWFQKEAGMGTGSKVYCLGDGGGGGGDGGGSGVWGTGQSALYIYIYVH